MDDVKPSPIPWVGILLFGLIAVIIFIVLTANINQKRPKKVVENAGATSSNYIDSTQPNYSIEEVQNKPAYCRITVRLQTKLSKENLQSLSDKIRTEQKCESNTVRIFYLLPETKIGNGAWVKVDYNPSFSMQYLGLSLEEEEYAKAHKGKFKVIGSWIDNNLGGYGGAQRIRYDSEGKLIMEYYEISNPDRESMGSIKLKKVVKNGKTIFNVVDSDTGDYYVLQPNGDLACYDNRGLIFILKKL